MYKLPIVACVALGLLTASCAGNANSGLPPAPSTNFGTATGTGAAAVPGAFTSQKVQGSWATTATQAVSPKFLGNGKSSASATEIRNLTLRIVVGLNMRNRKAADEFLRRQYTPGNVNFHRWMTPKQFTEEFNPTDRQVAAVETYLKHEGFSNVAAEPNNLMVTATGSVANAESAFHTTIRTSMTNGKLVYGNATPAQIPAQFRGLVVAVLGLNNTYQMHTHMVKSTRPMIPMATGTPPPCAEVVNGVCELGEYGPPQYQVAYNASTKVCPAACTGGHTAIAVMAEGNVTQVLSDLRKAESFWSLPAVPYTVKQVGVSSIDTSGIDEWDLDTQISSGIAQTVSHLYLYDTTSLTDSDTALEFSHWVNDRLTQAGNASFGEPESLAFADGSMLVDDEEFNQAASQGMTMFSSTGDNGEGCPVVAATGVPNTGVPEVCYPAASPYVVAVGGTTLDTTASGNQPGTYYGEHVWIGTGGGASKYETAPYWQSNGICATCSAGGLRSIADVSMCADNNGCPMDVFVNGAQTGVGGTSLSSPMSMGIWARLETHFNNGLGFAAPVYYGVYGYYEPCHAGSTACVPAGEPGTDTAALPPDTTAPIGGFHDILFGTNGIPSSAAPGWDMPTGLGSVNYCVMQQAIAKSIFSGH